MAILAGRRAADVGRDPLWRSYRSSTTSDVVLMIAGLSYGDPTDEQVRRLELVGAVPRSVCAGMVWWLGRRRERAAG